MLRIGWPEKDFFYSIKKNHSIFPCFCSVFPPVYDGVHGSRVVVGGPGVVQGGGAGPSSSSASSASPNAG